MMIKIFTMKIWVTSWPLKFIAWSILLHAMRYTASNISSPIVSNENISSVVTEIGGTFCSYFAAKSFHFKIPRKLFAACEEQSCNWDSWQHALIFPKKSQRKRVVLSYAHNGFGNQLWEHTVAFMFAESMQAKLLIAPVPSTLCPDHLYSTSGPCFPPHTLEGIAAMTRMLPDDFEYDMLPVNSSIRKLCEKEKFFFSDRPRDWRESRYKETFIKNAWDILTDPNPRCIKILGYFQDMPLCKDDAQRLWTPRMIANFSTRPAANDISIYLRCIRHYHFNDVSYYENILNRTSFDRVWLFQAPECTRFGPAAPVLAMLKARFNATRYVHVCVEN